MTAKSRMSVFERAWYALVASIVASAAISLLSALGSADAIAILPSSAFDLAMSRYIFLPIYVLAFLVAPWISFRFPITRR